MPTWAPVHYTDFTTQPNTANPGSGNVLVDGWIEYNSDLGFSIVSGQCVGAASFWPDGSKLIRPTIEGSLNQRIVATIASGFLGVSAANQYAGLQLRCPASDEGIGNDPFISGLVSGTGGIFIYLNGFGSFTSPVASFTPNSSHTYSIDFSAVGGDAGSATVLTITVTDLTTSTVVGTGSISPTYSGGDVTTNTPGLFVWIDPSGGTTATVPYLNAQTYTQVTGIAAGTLSLTSVSNTDVVLGWNGAVGGTGTLTCLLCRNPEFNFTPGSGNSIATVNADASGFPYTDSSPDESNPFTCYVILVTDSIGTTAISNYIVVGARTFLGGVFIGDSITFGPFDSGSSAAPPGQAALTLKQIRSLKTADCINSGVSGATTDDWVTASGVPAISTVVASAIAAGATFAHLMLGTNDAKNSVTPATFIANILNICGQILTAGLPTVVSYIIYCQPPGLNGSWPDSAVALIQQYNEQIAAIWNGTTILKGDTLGFIIFGENPALLEDLTHPTDPGNTVLGTLWAQAIDRALNPSGNSNPLVPGFIAA